MSFLFPSSPPHSFTPTPPSAPFLTPSFPSPDLPPSPILSLSAFHLPNNLLPTPLSLLISLPHLSYSFIPSPPTQPPSYTLISSLLPALPLSPFHSFTPFTSLPHNAVTPSLDLPTLTSLSPFPSHTTFALHSRLLPPPRYTSLYLTIFELHPCLLRPPHLIFPYPIASALPIPNKILRPRQQLDAPRSATSSDTLIAA